jgi:hypothetical protein
MSVTSKQTKGNEALFSEEEIIECTRGHGFAYSSPLLLLSVRSIC